MAKGIERMTVNKMKEHYALKLKQYPLEVTHFLVSNMYITMQLMSKIGLQDQEGLGLGLVICMCIVYMLKKISKWSNVVPVAKHAMKLNNCTFFFTSKWATLDARTKIVYPPKPTAFSTS